MAKQDSTASTTLSTRFDEQELALLRQATEKKQWSLSQLIRVGAYEKAVNIVNANSPAAYPVRRLLAEVVQQLFEAKVMVSDNYGPEGPCEFEPEHFGVHPDCDVYATTLKVEDGLGLVEGMRKLGAELAPMFAEELRRVFFAGEPAGGLIDPTVGASQTSDEPTERPSDPSGDQDQRKSKGAKKTPERKKSRKEN